MTGRAKAIVRNRDASPRASRRPMARARSLNALEQHQTQVALSTPCRRVKGSDVLGLPARLEDRLWELTRIVGALEGRLEAIQVATERLLHMLASFERRVDHC